MQCQHHARRVVCSSRNAYDPVVALRAAFTTQTIPRPKKSISRSPGAFRPLSASTRQNEDVTSIRRHAAYNNKDGKRRVHNPEQPFQRLDVSDLSRRTNMTNAQIVPIGPDSPDIAPRIWKEQMIRLREMRSSVNATKYDLDIDKVDPMIKRDFAYEGRVVVPPLDVPREPRELPWAVRQVPITSAQQVRDLLSKEIRLFADYIKPSSMEKLARRAAAEEVMDLIRRAHEGRYTKLRGIPLDCEIFGSEKTNLSIPVSDIDICIFPAGKKTLDGTKLQYKAFLTILHRLEHDGRFTTIVHRHGSSHHIINCQHKASGLDIQILGAQRKGQQQETAVKYLAEVPHAREVFVVARTFFAMRGLLDVFTGGMGSYGLFVMVVAALKSHSNQDLSLSASLRRFLRFYANLDTTRYGVAIFPRPRFLKHDSSPDYTKYASAAKRRGDLVRSGQWKLCQRNKLQPYLLCLQDPADPLNDLGKGGNAIKHVLTTIQYFRLRLIKNLKLLVEGQRIQPRSLLTLLVGRCHEVYYERRRKLHEYGQQVEQARLRHGQQGEQVDSTVWKPEIQRRDAASPAAAVVAVTETKAEGEVDKASSGSSSSNVFRRVDSLRVRGHDIDGSTLGL